MLLWIRHWNFGPQLASQKALLGLLQPQRTTRIGLPRLHCPATPEKINLLVKIGRPFSAKKKNRPAGKRFAFLFIENGLVFFLVLRMRVNLWILLTQFESKPYLIIHIYIEILKRCFGPPSSKKLTDFSGFPARTWHRNLEGKNRSNSCFK